MRVNRLFAHVALLACFASASWHRLAVPNAAEPHPNVTTDLPRWQRHPGPTATWIQEAVEGSYIIRPCISFLFYCPACHTLSSHTPYKSPLALTKLNNLAPFHILFSFPSFLHLMIRTRLEAKMKSDEVFLLRIFCCCCCFVLLHIPSPDFDLLCYE